jgi:hypothetical protein
MLKTNTRRPGMASGLAPNPKSNSRQRLKLKEAGCEQPRAPGQSACGGNYLFCGKSFGRAIYGAAVNGGEQRTDRLPGKGFSGI